VLRDPEVNTESRGLELADVDAEVGELLVLDGDEDALGLRGAEGCRLRRAARGCG
jgi:hypothetical protein